MSVLLVGFAEDRFDNVQKEAIREAAGSLELLYSRDEAEIERRLDEIEVAVGSFPRGLLLRASDLRWFQQWGAGADWLIEHPDIAEKDLALDGFQGHGLGDNVGDASSPARLVG